MKDRIAKIAERIAAEFDKNFSGRELMVLMENNGIYCLDENNNKFQIVDNIVDNEEYIPVTKLKSEIKEKYSGTNPVLSFSGIELGDNKIAISSFEETTTSPYDFFADGNFNDMI